MDELKRLIAVQKEKNLKKAWLKYALIETNQADLTAWLCLAKYVGNQERWAREKYREHKADIQLREGEKFDSSVVDSFNPDE